MHGNQDQSKSRNCINHLRKALDAQAGDKVEVVKKYFVSLPSELAHSGHAVGSIVAGFSQRVHPLISAKITELHGST